ncbi:MAG: DsbA family oxidoreductase [Cytobacillus gottheilii]|uniref:DsbA family oxidoreductase n=1 Tax=Cytobacillus gottheilii TaxID=859144 RepID=UPI00082FB5A8|nr:DsbA family oxidoreductase [Cytobacillus gottheilii]
MKIQVWSDFVCPFCYIGKRRLEKAIAAFEHSEQVEVEFKSFELDPNAKTNNGENIHEMLAAKYGMSVQQAKQTNEGLKQQAAAEGLTFVFDEMKPTNTFDAHRLAKFAGEKGKEAVVTEKLLAAYFTESKNLSDHETLIAVAEEAGLSGDEVKEVLADEAKFANDVRIDEALAQQYQITGVPFFIINNKYAISGAQPQETFEGALKKVWEEENETPVLKTFDFETKSESCSGDECELPEKDEN